MYSHTCPSYKRILITHLHIRTHICKRINTRLLATASRACRAGPGTSWSRLQYALAQTKAWKQGIIFPLTEQKCRCLGLCCYNHDFLTWNKGRWIITSMVLPLLAVKISPGRMASADTIFSQEATMKCASTSAGLSMPMAIAVPRVAAPPPMSNCTCVCMYVCSSCVLSRYAYACFTWHTPNADQTKRRHIMILIIPSGTACLSSSELTYIRWNHSVLLHACKENIHAYGARAYLHHLDHTAGASLDVVAARVKCEALANNGNFPLDLARGFVCQVNELGGLIWSCMFVCVYVCV